MLQYVVISAPHDCVDKLLDNWDKVFEEKVLLCVKELGTEGQHPHLNYIVDTNSRGDTYRIRVIRKLQKIGVVGNGHLVSVTKVTDVDKLIGGYLQKEPNYEILSNGGEYKLDELKKKYLGGKRIANHRFIEVLRVDTFAQAAHEYCLMKGMSLKGKTVEELLKMMAKDNYGIASCLRHADLCRQLIEMYYG